MLGKRRGRGEIVRVAWMTFRLAVGVLLELG